MNAFFLYRRFKLSIKTVWPSELSSPLCNDFKKSSLNFLETGSSFFKLIIDLTKYSYFDLATMYSDYKYKTIESILTNKVIKEAI